MAMLMKIILTVLAANRVVSQSTMDDSESLSDSDLVLQWLHLQLTNLEVQHQQMAQVLDGLLDRQQQQLNKLNELETILTNRLGKLCNCQCC